MKNRLTLLLSMVAWLNSQPLWAHAGSTAQHFSADHSHFVSIQGGLIVALGILLGLILWAVYVRGSRYFIAK